MVKEKDPEQIKQLRRHIRNGQEIFQGATYINN